MYSWDSLPLRAEYLAMQAIVTASCELCCCSDVQGQAAIRRERNREVVGFRSLLFPVHRSEEGIAALLSRKHLLH
jgi:hypothetical protein